MLIEYSLDHNNCQIFLHPYIMLYHIDIMSTILYDFVLWAPVGGGRWLEKALARPPLEIQRKIYFV